MSISNNFSSFCFVPCSVLHCRCLNLKTSYFHWNFKFWTNWTSRVDGQGLRLLFESNIDFTSVQGSAFWSIILRNRKIKWKFPISYITNLSANILLVTLGALPFIRYNFLKLLSSNNLISICFKLYRHTLVLVIILVKLFINIT